MSLLFQPCYTNFYTLKKVLFCRLLNDMIETRQKSTKEMKERVSKLTYPMLQHCLRMLYTMNGNSKH